MKKTENKTTKKVRKNKEIGVKITFSEEPCTKEESVQAIAKLCMFMLEADRDIHRKKLQEGVQHCDYCNKEITELNDFFSPDDKNCCFECGQKLLADPNRPKRFCGFPVRSDEE